MVSKLAISQPQFFFGFVCLYFVQVMYDFLPFLSDFFLTECPMGHHGKSAMFKSGNQITYNHIVADL